MGRVWTKDEIREGINSNIRWLLRGVTVIYERQTADERSAGETRHQNNVGFSAYDAHFLTSIAEQLGKGRVLSPKQLEVTRRKMQKYCGQLCDIANMRAAA